MTSLPPVSGFLLAAGRAAVARFDTDVAIRPAHCSAVPVNYVVLPTAHLAGTTVCADSDTAAVRSSLSLAAADFPLTKRFGNISTSRGMESKKPNKQKQIRCRNTMGDTGMLSKLS